MKILLISGSPRDGNSESILRKIKSLLDEKEIENELLLLREQNILKCQGCVEFCNHELKCKHNDDTAKLLEKFEQADRYIIATPTYFSMPPGLLKNFIDKLSIHYNRGTDFSGRKGAIITIGSGFKSTGFNAKCLEEFYRIFKIENVKSLCLKSKSEIPEKDHILTYSENPDLEKDLQDMLEKITQ